MVRSTFYGFEASRSALAANQKALDIVGNNIANANTDGYTRQRVETTSTYYSSTNNRVASSTIGSAGAGVTMLGVSQIRDAFVDKSYRDENALMNYYSKSSEIGTEIKNVFPEGADVTTGAGIVGAIEALQKNLTTYLSNPTLESEANIVKSSFSSITQILKKSATELDTIATRQTADLQTTVNRTNEILDQIQHYNSMIASEKNAVSQISSEFFSPNELMDKRNLLLDELSQYASINVSRNGDDTVNVSFVKADGTEEEAVDGTKVTTLPNHIHMSTGSSTITLTWQSGTKDAAGVTTYTDMKEADGSTKSVSLKNGSIKASVEVLTGDGTTLTADGNRVQGIPYYMNKLDTFAKQLAEVVNSAIPKSATDPTGRVLLSNGNGNDTDGIKASNISISEDWAKDPSRFIFSKDENAGKYAQLLSETIGSKTNTFVTKKDPNDNTSATIDIFTGSFSEYITNTAGQASTDVSFNNSCYTAAKAVANDFLTARDAISGVQRDEETSNMLEFQKAYQASARMMTVMDSILDVLINQIGARIAQ